LGRGVRRRFKWKRNWRDGIEVLTNVGVWAGVAVGVDDDDGDVRVRVGVGEFEGFGVDEACIRVGDAVGVGLTEEAGVKIGVGVSTGTELGVVSRTRRSM